MNSDTLQLPIPGTESTLNSQLVLDEKTKKQLDKRIASFVHVIITMDVRSDKFNNYVEAIHDLGINDMRKASDVSRRAMNNSVNTLVSETPNKKNIIHIVDELRLNSEMLDPIKQGDLLRRKKFLGLIPLSVRKKLIKYFERCELLQDKLNPSIEKLLETEDVLRLDITRIKVEQEKLSVLTKTLNGHLYVAEQAGKFLSENIKRIQENETDKAQLIINNLIPDLQQKRIDLMTQVTANNRADLSMGLMKTSNSSLIESLENTTRAILVTLVKVKESAQKICGKRITFSQIKALNKDTTEIIVEAKNKFSQDNAKQEIEALKSNFDALYAALNDVKIKEGNKNKILEEYMAA